MREKEQSRKKRLAESLASDPNYFCMFNAKTEIVSDAVHMIPSPTLRLDLQTQPNECRVWRTPAGHSSILLNTEGRGKGWWKLCDWATSESMLESEVQEGCQIYLTQHRNLVAGSVRVQLLREAFYCQQNTTGLRGSLQAISINDTGKDQCKHLVFWGTRASPYFNAPILTQKCP